MRPLLFTAISLVTLNVCGQVAIDAPVQLTGSNAADRQVTGLAPLTDPSVALSVEVERRGMVVHTAAGTGTNWTLDIPALSGPPLPGTHITVSVPENANGPVSLLLNGLGPYNVVTGPTTLLEGSLVPAGSVLSLVFTGTDLQLMNGGARMLRPCPSGMVAANGQFCIDVQQDTASVDFFAAARACGDRGSRLCSWAEFHVACANAAALSLANMVGDYEWIGSTCNEDGSARIVGSSGCTSVACALAFGSTDRPYRCCTER